MDQRSEMEAECQCGMIRFRVTLSATEPINPWDGNEPSMSPRNVARHLKEICERRGQNMEKDNASTTLDLSRLRFRIVEQSASMVLDARRQQCDWRGANRKRRARRSVRSDRPVSRTVQRPEMGRAFATGSGRRRTLVNATSRSR